MNAMRRTAMLVTLAAIGDATGLSHPMVGAELLNDITEMVRSAVNRIGDRVVYVPFQPDYGRRSNCCLTRTHWHAGSGYRRSRV